MKNNNFDYNEEIKSNILLTFSVSILLIFEYLKLKNYKFD